MVKYSTLTPGAAATIAAFKDVTLLAPAPVLVPTPADSFPVVVLESLVDVGGAPLMVVSGPGPSEGEEAVAGEALKSELELVTVAGEAFHARAGGADSARGWHTTECESRNAGARTKAVVCGKDTLASRNDARVGKSLYAAVDTILKTAIDAVCAQARNRGTCIKCIDSGCASFLALSREVADGYPTAVRARAYALAFNYVARLE